MQLQNLLTTQSSASLTGSILQRLTAAEGWWETNKSVECRGQGGGLQTVVVKVKLRQDVLEQVI